MDCRRQGDEENCFVTTRFDCPYYVSQVTIISRLLGCFRQGLLDKRLLLSLFLALFFAQWLAINPGTREFLVFRGSQGAAGVSLLAAI
jgi:hypothetical protein